MELERCADTVLTTSHVDFCNFVWLLMISNAFYWSDRVNQDGWRDHWKYRDTPSVNLFSRLMTFCYLLFHVFLSQISVVFLCHFGFLWSGYYISLIVPLNMLWKEPEPGRNRPDPTARHQDLMTCFMMTSSNWNIFHAIVPLRGESTSHETGEWYLIKSEKNGEVSQRRKLAL